MAGELVGFDKVFDRFDLIRIDHQRDPAGELSAKRVRGGSNPVGKTGLIQPDVHVHALIPVLKKNVVLQTHGSFKDASVFVEHFDEGADAGSKLFGIRVRIVGFE